MKSSPVDGEVSNNPSSIDRFFWSKGSRFIGYSGNPWQLVGGILGGSYGLVAIIFVIVAKSTKGFPDALPIIFGSLAIGTLIATIYGARRSKKSIQFEVKLSSSGRKMLYRIGQHIGWRDHEMTYGFGYSYAPRASIWRNIFGVKTARDILTPQSALVLEEGCSEYNRIGGLLKLAKDSKGRSTNMAPQIQAASDEAMVSLINQVALLEESPETQNAILAQCQSQNQKLKELANRYEELLSGPITLEDRLSSTTVMDNVLDQMRMEAQAHEELRIMDRQD